MESFITVAIFNYAHEITILKHRLDQEGIQYYFENEAIAAAIPMSSVALGGIKLKIHPNDMDTVQIILDELNGNTSMKIV